MWKTLSGAAIGDVLTELRQLVAAEAHELHIGTDAKRRGDHTDFVTVIALLTPTYGGRVFYRGERTPRSRSLAHQLFYEVELSLRTATAISDELGIPITIHVDANEDQRHRSSRYVQALAGMVAGYGYDVRVKPEAWCATHVADFVVKEKNTRAA